MKKILGLSLIASFVCLGTANAQSLSEAIENVDISGSVVYRYEDATDDLDGETATKRSRYKVGINVSSKVNEDVKFNTRIIAGNLADNGFQNMDYRDEGDQALDIGLSHVYFTYTGFKNTSINIGKQGLNTPWTKAIDISGNEQTGTGIFATTNLSGVTLQGGYFNQTNLDTSGDTKAEFEGSSNIYTVGAITKVGPVKFDAWYMNLSSKGDGDGSADDGLGFDSYTIGAATAHKFGDLGLSLDARYTSLTFEDDRAKTVAKDNSLFDIGLKAKYDIFNGEVRYFISGEDGGLVGLDQNAITSYTAWNFDFDDKRDGTALRVSGGAKITDKFSVSLAYLDGEYRNLGDTQDEEITSIYSQFTYKMSKNFSAYIRLGTFEETKAGVKDDDEVKSRLQLAYKF